MTKTEQRAALFSINWQLHKQGKHACAACLNVFDWTHENFRWRNEAKGWLDSTCNACQPALNRKYRISGEKRRRSFERILGQAS